MLSKIKHEIVFLLLTIICGCFGNSVVEHKIKSSTSMVLGSTTTVPKGVACGTIYCPVGYICISHSYEICVLPETTTTIISTLTTNTNIVSHTTSTSTTSTTLNGFNRLFNRIHDKQKSTTTTTRKSITPTIIYVTTTTIEGITPPYENKYVMGEDGYWGGRTDI
jgi:hypothetical protein